MSIFTTIGNAISSFFKKEAPIVEAAFSKATVIVNVVKTFLGSATGQTLEAIIEALAPGVGTVVIGALNTFFIDFGLVTAELNKPASEITADGFNALAKLAGNSKVIALQNVATIIGHTISTVNGGGSTIQQATVAVPLVYNPNVLNDATVAPASAQQVAPIIPSYDQQIDPNA